MTISDKTLREMLKTVKEQVLYGETDERSPLWLFDCGARTAIASMECAIWKEVSRLEKEAQNGTTA